MPENHNLLINENSPYLLQHALNPVEWRPWGEDAFAKAKAENKPVFLSIGYSTCHWCHVMAHESFENPETAQALNDGFISIKVDREERPDIDSVYMSVCQAMTGAGGWPLSIFMTPEKLPFFAGTYFPPVARYNMPAFNTILSEISDMWKNNRSRIDASAKEIAAHLRTRVSGDSKTSIATPGAETLKRAFLYFNSEYDKRFGGFRESGPKFPTPHNLTFLLRHWKKTGDPAALNMAVNTLDRINRGGIHDHVGGGFHRYSTDREWFVPHFEKMLYDQALLARAFLEAYQATLKREFADAARDIFDYILRDMTSPEGGFYSAEDADSEGAEGKFYVWTKTELNSLLGNHAALFADFYGVVPNGNFEDSANILHVSQPLDDFAKSRDYDIDKLASILAEGRAKLFVARNRRQRPHLDDKIIASWNGLMISSFAFGARVLGEARYAQAAGKAADFVLTNMRANGRIFRRRRAGDTAVNGFLDDYAFLALALLDLYEATFDPLRIQQANDIADSMIAKFHDPKSGGFFFSSIDNETLISEIKEAYDGAEPSGNSIAALALLKLAKFTENIKYEHLADGVFSAFAAQIEKYPPAFTQMLNALDFAIGPSAEIVVSGDPENPETKEFLKSANSAFLPNAVLAFAPASAAKNPETSYIPIAASKKTDGGKSAAFVCSNRSCKPPAYDIAAFNKILATL
ncbi:MAG: thioredoxin domain-containing protein [bacterium]